MTDTKLSQREETAQQDAVQQDTASMLPPVDIVENVTGITLYADLPGVTKDRLTVRVEADTLLIEGEVSLPLVKDMAANHVEVQLPRYRRAFTLGQELDSDKIAAEFKHGVLKLHIPKAEHAKPRKIEVRVA